MNHKAISLAIALVLGLSACASVGADIKTETLVDPKVNLSGYKTYAWVGGLAVLQDDAGQWAAPGFDLNAEVRFLIDREMQARDMHFAEGSPDLLVSYLLVVNMDAQEADLKARYGEDVDLSNLHEGGLLIALIDPQTSKAIWAGAATAQVKMDRSDAQTKERLSIAVDKLFADFGK